MSDMMLSDSNDIYFWSVDREWCVHLNNAEPGEFFRAACKRFGVSKREFRGRSQKRRLVAFRAMVAYVLRHEYGWKFSHIGDIMDRDHTTVMNLINQMTHSRMLYLPLLFPDIYPEFLPATNEPKNPRKMWLDEHYKQLRELVNDGLNTKQISERMGFSIWAIQKKRNDLGIGVKRTRHLTARQRLEIARQYNTSVNKRDLARRYNVTVGYASELARRFRNGCL